MAMQNNCNILANVRQRPILFSTEMVRAILDGRKTMTRRIIKPQPIIDNDSGFVYSGNHRVCIKNDMFHRQWAEAFERFCPYGEVGDILWVRETWKPKYLKRCLYEFQLKYTDVCPWFYAADGDCEKGYGSWKPSIHMPKEAARLFLRITDIRVERLQNISEEDAISEGIKKVSNHNQWYNYLHPKNAVPAQMWVRGAVNSFETLWASINGFESWQSNPWVWVVSFEQIQKPE